MTDDIDPRWHVEFTLKETVKGSPPKMDEGIVRYAIHSPSQRGLSVKVGEVFRITGELVGKETNKRHQIKIELKGP